MAFRGLLAQGKTARFFPFTVSIFLILFGGAVPCANATTVWLDTDASIGSPIREVDDAFALLLAFRCSNLRIAGISTTYGNASLTRTTAVTTDFVGRFGRGSGGETPAIHPGARSRKELGVETAASRALAQVLRENRSVVYVALGPLTNLATFEMLHPELARRIHHVIFIGGLTEQSSLRFGARHPIQIHDANVFKDPEAVRRVLQSKIPMTLVPIESASQITVDGADLEEIGRDSEAGQFLRKNSGVWLWFWTRYVGTAGGLLFDAAAVVAAAEPTLLGMETRFATMNPSGDLLVARNRGPRSRIVRCCPRLTIAARQFARRKLGARGGAATKPQDLRHR